MLTDLNIKNYSHWICGCICVCLYVLSHLSRARLCNPVDRSLLGSSVHGILPGRILEWVAMPSSRGSDQGIKPLSPALQENSLLLSHGETQYIYIYIHIYMYIYVHFFSFHVFLTFQCKLRGLVKQVRSGPESCHSTAPSEHCRPCWLQGWVGEGDGAGPGGGVLGAQNSVGATCMVLVKLEPRGHLVSTMTTSPFLKRCVSIPYIWDLFW